MPEQLVASVPGRLRVAPWPRRLTWSLACMLPLCGMSVAAFAQGVPAALRACAAETDAGQRLDCYDREMARLPPTPAQAAHPAAPAKPDIASSPSPAPSSAAEATSATPAQSLTSAPAQSSNSTPAQGSNTSAEQAAPAAAKSADAAPASAASGSHWTAPLKKIFGGGSQVTAHVASLDRWPNAMVLHLDNGQVWHQVGRASGDLSLHAGDSVTIEKHLGSYWLSSRYVSNMQVRLDPQQAH